MIRLAKPQINIDVLNDLRKVLESGNLVQGEYVHRLEQRLSEYLDNQHVVIVTSGTAALHLSLISLDVKNNDEVIIPAFTFPATANVVEMVGAKPVLVDIATDDYCIDVDKIEEAITEKTKAIIPVHEFGQSADIKSILKIAEIYNVRIIEDAACALGACFDNIKVGLFGDLGCFSFHPRKTITTGEGGAIVTQENELYKKIVTLRNHGISSVNGNHDFVRAGLNYRMTELQAVLGLSQIEEYDKILEKRKSIAKEFNSAFADLKHVKTPKIFKNRENIYQTYHLLLSNGRIRDNLMGYLRELGIESNYGANAINETSYYREKYSYLKNEFFNASMSYNCGIALPIGSHLNDEDVDCVIRTVLNFFSEYQD